MDQLNKFCFTSEMFDIAIGEDEETNPHCFGKALAEWVCLRFKKLGYPNSEVIPEDWGWCVSLISDPFHIFVACGCFVDFDSEYDPQNPPNGNDVTWQCFIGSDTPFFRNPFKKLDRAKEKEIELLLFNLLSETDGVVQVDEP